MGPFDGSRLAADGSSSARRPRFGLLTCTKVFLAVEKEAE
jgi:hypothetical protein